MYLRLIGSCLIVAGSGGVGVSMAAQYMRSYKGMKQLTVALERMICEVEYRLSPLPELCREAARYTDGPVRKLFLTLAEDIEDRLSPDVFQCMCNAIRKTEKLPATVLPYLKQLGKCLGQYDLDGQVRVLESLREECRRSMESMEDNKAYRIRSYQTLSLCAGAALAVLLL